MLPRVHRFSLSFLATLPAALAAQGPRPIAISDLTTLKTVGAPRLSPDGNQVAYTISTADVKKDRTSTRIWMSPVAGGDAIPMTGAGAPGSNRRDAGLDPEPAGRRGGAANRGEAGRGQLRVVA